MQLSRRGFLGGLLAVVSAPAIVRVESIMPVRVPKLETFALDFAVGDIISFEGGEEFAVTAVSNSMLTIDKITRAAIGLWTNSNTFIKSIDKQYDREFAADQAQIGSTLQIKLLNDFTTGKGHQFA